MITITLDAAREEQLRKVAEARHQEPSLLAQRVLEQYLEFNAATEDPEDAWAEASAALSGEVFPEESWEEE
jgi:predicted transcriptional regulator